MGRTLTFNNAANEFVQGFSFNNVEITLFMRGGDDAVDLNRADDFGGGNTVHMGLGHDTVVNRAEQGNLITLGDGRDTYVGTGFGSFGTDRADTVLGGLGNDLFAVTTFKSDYRGEAGNDRFISVGWQNSFRGGTGTDTISYEARNDDSTTRGTGVTIDLGAGLAQTGANRFETLLSIENAIGSPSGDTIFGTGGANRLVGGGGFDDLVGRGGADTFVWRNRAEAQMTPSSADFVLDFSHAEGDLLDLRGIDAIAGTAANDAFRFLGTGAFTGQAGELRLGAAQFIGDVTGDGIADQGRVLGGDTNGDRQADVGLVLVNVGGLQGADLML